MGKVKIYTREECEECARTIDDGSYFKEARRWYSVVYMSIMSERCLYIILTSLAVISGTFALIALLQLLPISPAQPLLYPMKDVVKDIPVIEPLRDNPHQPVNDALQRFFLTEYVEKREGYNFDTIQPNFRFLRNYSSKEVMAVYQRYIDPSSPRSPINVYERKTTRKINVTRIITKRTDNQPEEWLKDGQYLADVYFTARVYTPTEVKITNWKAEILFDYVQLKMIQPEDPAKGELKVEPMKFNVIDYTVIEMLPQTKE